MHILHKNYTLGNVQKRSAEHRIGDILLTGRFTDTRDTREIREQVNMTCWYPIDHPPPTLTVDHIQSRLTAIRASAESLWIASQGHETMPKFRLCVGPQESPMVGFELGYRRRDGSSAVNCAMRKCVWTAITNALADESPDAKAVRPATIHVRLTDQDVTLPCRTVPAAAFLEELWRQTGADVPGEQADYTCECGGRECRNTYTVHIVDDGEEELK